MGNSYTKNHFLFIWNSNLTRHPLFLFMKPGNPRSFKCSRENFGQTLLFLFFPPSLCSELFGRLTQRGSAVLWLCMLQSWLYAFIHAVLFLHTYCVSGTVLSEKLKRSEPCPHFSYCLIPSTGKIRQSAIVLCGQSSYHYCVNSSTHSVSRWSLC